MYLLQEVLLPLRILAHKYAEREKAFPMVHRCAFIPFFVYVNISVFYVVFGKYSVQSSLKLHEDLMGFYIVQFLLE